MAPDFKAPPVLVAGGYGVFGSWTCRELVARGVAVTVAGRDGERARALAGALGPGADALALDVTDPDACRRALRGRRVAVLAAGPFSALGTALLDAARVEGCDHVDLADDRAFVRRVRERDADLRAAGRLAVYGASSLPGLSGALAATLLDGSPEPPESIRAVLFIGNANRKGSGAIDSLVASMGRELPTPQGTRRGLGDPERIEIPVFGGRRRVANFDAPEYDLFAPSFGARTVRVQVGFELPGAIAMLSTLSRLRGAGRAVAAVVARIGRVASGWGRSGGVVLVEVRFAGGSRRTGWVGGPSDGQRMAVLPAVLAVEAILDRGGVPGAYPAWEYPGAKALLDGVARAGFEVSLGV